MLLVILHVGYSVNVLFFLERSLKTDKRPENGTLKSVKMFNTSPHHLVT